MFILMHRLAVNMEWLPDAWSPQVVVIDIDGTITDENKTLSSEAVEALRRLEANGIPVVLATGNVRPVVRTVAVHWALCAHVLRKWRRGVAPFLG